MVFNNVLVLGPADPNGLLSTPPLRYYHAAGAPSKFQWLRTAQCDGHSGAVLGADWGWDGRTVQSTCAAREVLVLTRESRIRRSWSRSRSTDDRTNMQTSK
jgi:hypothetical protein